MLEEKFLYDNSPPIEIERIWGGKFNEYLLVNLFGKDAIYPYRYSAFRIIARIADNFENLPEEKPENLQDEEFKGLYDFSKIKKKIIKID